MHPNSDEPLSPSELRSLDDGLASIFIDTKLVGMWKTTLSLPVPVFGIESFMEEPSSGINDTIKLFVGDPSQRDKATVVAIQGDSGRIIGQVPYDDNWANNFQKMLTAFYLYRGKLN